MYKKISCIMLIDDNVLNNSFHELIIRKTGITEQVIAKESGIEALECLKNQEETNPELIFLDINMPGMTGWDFLEEYKSSELIERHKPVIVMLSTSDDPSDIARAQNDPLLSEYRTKPLSKKMLEEIRDKYFRP